MKASLLVAMLTGRVFHVRWDEPFPVHALLRPERIDWRTPEGDAALPHAEIGAAGGKHSASDVQILCLPFATAPPGADCGGGLTALRTLNLRTKYQANRVLEVHTFTDLNIYLATNPHYAPLLARLGATCPKRMGCLYNFLFTPQPAVQAQLDTLRPPAAGATASASAGAGAPYYAVQVRNRLWRVEAMKAAVQQPSPERIIGCMNMYVPRDAAVFFTADEDSLYAPARRRWDSRLIEFEGGVFMPWSKGGKVDAATLGDDDERAVLKAIVDWFMLQRASRLVYTYQSSFGKTAAEASDAPNLDVNQTRCIAAEQLWSSRAEEGGTGGGDGGQQQQWEYEWAATADGVAYDTSKVPGAV